MQTMRCWFGRLTVALACLGLAGMSQAEELAVQSFNGSGRLVFNTLHSATNYRVEWASSPAGPWTNFIGEALAQLDSISAVDASSVTCAVPVFYRVVASVTNGWLSLDVSCKPNFGIIEIGDTSVMALTLINRGGGPLTVTGIECPDGFSCNWSGVIQAGYQQVVAVTFAPLAAKAYGGTLCVKSDAAGGLCSLAVSGQGASDFLAIDVSSGPSSTSYPVSYYQTLEDVPGGANSDTFKTTCILMRRIPKDVFMMGSPSGELGRVDDETQHSVRLTQWFYVGVFEITQKQWERVMGGWPSYFNNERYRDARPVEQVSYYAIRGLSAGANWPETNNVDASSFMGKLRLRTGLAFDLPTEAQWEYACRAGTSTALNSGYNLTNTSLDACMAEVGRYHYNGGLWTMYDGDTSLGTAKAGSYLPNAWGLYDMHGNVWEWCLDWYGAYPGTVSDPKGTASGTDRVIRGGYSGNMASYCRSACRNDSAPDYAAYSVGFRVALPSVNP